MDKQQAIRIVNETLQNPFDRERYRRFIKELLNHIDEEGARNNQGNLIPKAYQEYVGRLERIGKYFSNGKEIMLFIVYLKKETSIERARSMQRNFIAGYLSGKHGGAPKDAALAAFVSPNSADWRFSLIKMEYSIGQTAKGKPKIEEEFTPARRWSFLVGPNEKSHTAQSRLVPLMMDDVNGPSLEELEEAFNIEKVTDEFFTEYRNLFIRTKEELDRAVAASPQTKSDFESKGVNTVDFAKKLLGQIVFLYFLQKKGWFGVPRAGEWGSGSKNFLRELFAKKHGDYGNFFNDILEPLFYEALRNDRQHDDHYYSRFNCKIPFLNGGLFDPIGNYDWVKTDILLPDELFSNTRKTKEGDTGDGILDIFDRYNFTVREDEPYEKEVAIDPELLGKAYEKFNAIRPDNFNEYLQALNSGKKGEESKFNKQYGVYYTPREIVHYMCRQSLINYLYTGLNPEPAASGDSYEAAKEISISREDIEALIYHGESVGEHEAQVISQGRETGRYSHRLPESIRIHAEVIDEKLAQIRVCDPAVGSGAFPVGMMGEIVRARSLLATFLKKGKTLYDFKRECIENSLYGVDIDPGAVEIAKLRLWLSLVVDEDDIQNIKPLPNLDYKIVCGNSLVGVKKNLFNHQFFDELETLKPLYFNETNPTEKQKYKKQINGLIDQITNGRVEFDFEIYFSEVFHEKGGFDVVIGNPPYGAKVPKDEEKALIIKYPIIKKFPDTYCCFIVRSVELLKPFGKLAFIVPNTFCDLESCNEFRKWLLTNNELLEIYQTGWAFEQAIVDTIAFFLNKNSRAGNYRVSIKIEEQKYFRKVDEFIKNKLHKIDYRNNADISGLLNKMGNFLQLFNFAEVKAGVKLYEKGKGTPSQTEEIMLTRPYTSQRYIDGWLPLYRGEDILRYEISKAKEFVNYGPWLAAPRSPELFKSPKILMRRTDDKLRSCLETEDAICVNSCHVIKLNGNGYKRLTYSYLLGLLNSKLLQRVFELQNPQMVGKIFSEIKVIYVENLPIRDIDFSNPFDCTTHDRIVSLVDRILVTKHANSQADTSKWEEEIDQLVYQLYGLTEEEIRIVERTNN